MKNLHSVYSHTFESYYERLNNQAKAFIRKK